MDRATGDASRGWIQQKRVSGVRASVAVMVAVAGRGSGVHRGLGNGMTLRHCRTDRLLSEHVAAHSAAAQRFTENMPHLPSLSHQGIKGSPGHSTRKAVSGCTAFTGRHRSLPVAKPAVKARHLRHFVPINSATLDKHSARAPMVCQSDVAQRGTVVTRVSR